nr:cytochrome b [Amblyseius swirskii]
MVNMLKIWMSPMPANISYWWNFGSLLGMALAIQIISGLFLSMYFENSISQAFNSISQIERNINMGWLMRSIHSNGASLFFMFIYLHIGRNLFYKSYNLKKVWMSGVIMLLLLFTTAFIGYVLPWGQMSFWGATVITNLLTSIPYIGKPITLWIWGGFSINKATLTRFFTFHFILPFILLMSSMIHIFLLHQKSSNNPLGTNSFLDKTPFHPYFSIKDILGMLMTMNLFMMICSLTPFILMDPDNFIPANPIVTPPHIQPEWYFLFAYAILRTIPNKLGGVLALMSSILILLSLPFMKNKPLENNFVMLYLFKIIFFIWVNNFILLTLMGSMPIELPYSKISEISSVTYFMFYFLYI